MIQKVEKSYCQWCNIVFVYDGYPLTHFRDECHTQILTWASFTISPCVFITLTYNRLAATCTIFGWLQACCRSQTLSSHFVWWSSFPSRSNQSKGGCSKWTQHTEYIRISWNSGRYEHIYTHVDCTSIYTHVPQVSRVKKHGWRYLGIESEEMIRGLQQLGWKKVDVSFQSALLPFFAHNNINVWFKPVYSFLDVVIFVELSTLIADFHINRWRTNGFIMLELE